MKGNKAMKNDRSIIEQSLANLTVSLGSVLILLAAVAWGQAPANRSQSFPLFLQPQMELLLSAETGGLVRQVNYEAQDYVAAGEVLIALDSTTVELELEALKARRELSTVMQDAQIKLDYAKDNLTIVKDLYEKMIGDSRVGSSKELKQAQQTWELTVLGTKNAELELAILDISIRQREYELKKLRIAAPVEGVLVPFASIKSLKDRLVKRVEAGEMMAPSQPAMAMMKVDFLRIDLLLTVEQMDAVRIGQPARVFIEGADATPVEATVIFISPTVNGPTSQFHVEVEFKNPAVDLKDQPAGSYPFRFRPGMRARVEMAGLAVSGQ